MERIKNLLLEARTDLKDFKEKQKVSLDQLYQKSTGAEVGMGADASTLLEMVKFINVQVLDAQARVLRLEQELGQTWDVGTKLYANTAATATPTQDQAAADKAKKREEDMENFRKKVLGYCNGSRGVNDDVEQWKLHLPQIATKAKKYLTEDQFDALQAVANSVEDIKSTRAKLTKWYESAFPSSKRPSGPKDSGSKATTTTTTAKPKSSAPSAEKAPKAVATPKSTPKPAAKAVAAVMETSDDDEDDDNASASADDEVKVVPEAKKKTAPTTTTTTTVSRTIGSSEEDKKSKLAAKKSLPKAEEAPSSSKKAKVAVAAPATDDDISSVASSEDEVVAKKPKKSETKPPKKKD